MAIVLPSQPLFILELPANLGKGQETSVIIIIHSPTIIIIIHQLTTNMTTSYSFLPICVPVGQGYLSTMSSSSSPTPSFFNGEAPLSPGIGYAICLGFGAAFSVFTTLLVSTSSSSSTSSYPSFLPSYYQPP